MSFHLSKHEKDRVGSSIGSVRSKDIIDFPNQSSLSSGDMLKWHISNNGTGKWIKTPGTGDNYDRIVDNSNNIAALNTKIDITKIETLEDIVNIFTDNLKKVLKENNFEILLESVNVKKFHVHSHQLEDILVSNKDETFYVCDHCSS